MTDQQLLYNAEKMLLEIDYLSTIDKIQYVIAASQLVIARNSVKSSKSKSTKDTTGLFYKESRQTSGSKP